MTANVETMYSGEGLTPWHRRGTILDGLLTAVAALQPAGLTWDPELRKMFTEHGLVDNYRAVVRSDNGKALGVVSDLFRPITNLAAAQACDAAVGGEACCTTAGSLRDGAIVWFCLKLGEFQINGDPSPTVLYMVVTNRHDGRGKARVLITPVRVVCENTLRAAMWASKWETGVIHVGDTDAKVADATKLARDAVLFGERFKAAGDLLVATPYADEFGPVLAQVLTATSAERDWLRDVQTSTTTTPPAWCPDPGAPIVQQLLQAAPHIPADLVPRKVREERETMERLIVAGTGVADTEIQGTAWGAFQGVAEWTDHHKSAGMRDTRLGSGADRRAESILWGQAADTKSDALEVILAQVGGDTANDVNAIMTPPAGAGA